jgi:CheY-specific phosphatase CheX
MSVNENTPIDPTLGLTVEDLVEVLKESADEVFSTMLGMVGVLVEQHMTGDAGQPGEIRGTDSGETRSEFEAIVEFSGMRRGAVVLRAGHEGALDIARGLLMLGDEETVEVEEVMDALGECANMVSGSLKCKVLDPAGDFHLGTPRIGSHIVHDHDEHLGGLVYRLARGCTSVEVWMDEPKKAA